MKRRTQRSFRKLSRTGSRPEITIVSSQPMTDHPAFPDQSNLSPTKQSFSPELNNNIFPESHSPTDATAPGRIGSENIIYPVTGNDDEAGEASDLLINRGENDGEVNLLKVDSTRTTSSNIEAKAQLLSESLSNSRKYNNSGGRRLSSVYLPLPLPPIATVVKATEDQEISSPLSSPTEITVNSLSATWETKKKPSGSKRYKRKKSQTHSDSKHKINNSTTDNTESASSPSCDTGEVVSMTTLQDPSISATSSSSRNPDASSFVNPMVSRKLPHPAMPLPDLPPDKSDVPVFSRQIRSASLDIELEEDFGYATIQSKLNSGKTSKPPIQPKPNRLFANASPPKPISQTVVTETETETKRIEVSEPTNTEEILVQEPTYAKVNKPSKPLKKTTCKEKDVSATSGDDTDEQSDNTATLASPESHAVSNHAIEECSPLVAAVPPSSDDDMSGGMKHVTSEESDSLALDDPHYSTIPKTESSKVIVNQSKRATDFDVASLIERHFYEEIVFKTSPTNLANNASVQLPGPPYTQNAQLDSKPASHSPSSTYPENTKESSAGFHGNVTHSVSENNNNLKNSKGKDKGKKKPPKGKHEKKQKVKNNKNEAKNVVVSSPAPSGSTTSSKTDNSSVFSSKGKSQPQIKLEKNDPPATTTSNKSQATKKTSPTAEKKKKWNILKSKSKNQTSGNSSDDGLLKTTKEEKRRKSSASPTETPASKIEDMNQPEKFSSGTLFKKPDLKTGSSEEGEVQDEPVCSTEVHVSASSVTTRQQNVTNENHITKFAKPKLPPKKIKLKATETRKMTATALYDHKSGANGHLSFNAGDDVELLESTTEEWCKGRIGNRVGIFPTSLVGLINIKTDGKPSRSETFFAHALYDFKGIHNNELSFQAGDKIEVVCRAQEGWLKGRKINASFIGIFPASLLDSVSPDVPTESQLRLSMTQLANLNVSNGGNTLSATPVELNPFQNPNSPVTAIAMFEHQSQDSLKLSFKPNDVITVTGKVNNAWFQGSLHGNTGIFPSTYVQLKYTAHTNT